MYRVEKAHGSGGMSNWYVVKRDIPTLEEAKQTADAYRAENPESDGWNRIVAVVTTDDNGDDKVHYRC